jgi:hypothetical protein
MTWLQIRSSGQRPRGLRWMADFDVSSGEPEPCPDPEQPQTQLDNEPEQETPNDLLFKPPCGFKLEGRDSSLDAMDSQIAYLQRQKDIYSIDMQIACLQRQKYMLLMKDVNLVHLELRGSRERAGSPNQSRERGGGARSN